MKILMLAPDYRFRSAWGCELFRDEIARQHEVVRYHGDAGNLHVPDLLSRHPDCDIVLMAQLQFGRYYTGMADVSIPTVCWVEDYFPRHHEIKNSWLRQHKFDLVFLTQDYFVPTFKDFQKDGQVPWQTRVVWLPFSVDTTTYFGSVYRDRGVDVAAIFSSHAFEYPKRKAVVDEINDMLGVNAVAKLARNQTEGVYHRSYVRLLENSKIGIASLDQHGSCNQRHYEIPACGAMLLTDGPPRDFGLLGFREGTHYVRYEGTDDLHEKIRYYLEHENDRLAIAFSGQSLVAGRHSNVSRVRDMTKIICEVLFNAGS